MKIPNAQIENYITKIDKEKVSGCLIYGPENHLVSYRFNQIAKKITPDLSDPFLVTNISKERLSNDKSILSDELNSYSMLGGRKLIMIQDCDVLLNNILKNVNKSDIEQTTNFILVQAGDLEKNSYLRKFFEESDNLVAIACYEDSEATVKNILLEKFRKNNIKVSSNQVQLILDRVGKNRMLINNEVEKIITFLGEKKELSDAEIFDIIGLQSESSIEEFLNLFAEKKYNSSLLLLQKLISEGLEAVYFFRYLNNYFQKIYQSRVLIDREGVSFDESVSMHRLFFRVEPHFRSHLQKFSLKELKIILKKINDFETKVKSSNVSQSLVISEFVADFLQEKII